jgi:zinc transport system ATP-binding protein
MILKTQRSRPKNEGHALLEMQNVSCGYRQRCILKEVNLSLFPAESLAIIGDNGQGKSTLLKTLMGLQKPIHGQRLQHHSSKEMGYVPQWSNREFLMPMPVKHFVALGLVHQAKGKAEQQIQHALDRVNLLDQQGKDISILSGGQFQRAVLARALVCQPTLLYLDEPTTGLDRRSSREFMNELKEEQHNTQMACVMVLHDFRYLQEDFERVAWVHDGITEVKDVNEAMKDLSFREFIGMSL